MTMVTHAAPRRCHTPITGHRGHAAAARGGRRRRSAGRKRATLSRRSTSPAVHGSATIGLSSNLVSSSFRCFFRSSERRCLPLPSASEAIKLQGRAAELDVDAFPPALGRWRSSRHAHNSRVRSGRDIGVPNSPRGGGLRFDQRNSHGLRWECRHRQHRHRPMAPPSRSSRHILISSRGECEYPTKDPSTRRGC